MILIAADKFKGTLSAAEVCGAIAGEITRASVLCPMADGGEGTAAIYAGITGMRNYGMYYADPLSLTAIIESSVAIGHEAARKEGWNVMTATSYPLGRIVGKMLSDGMKRIFIGVGGTATCDGGIGFIRGLEDYAPSRCDFKRHLVGLVDVAVPLVSSDGNAPSALMFAPQKGATLQDMPVLRERLESLYKKCDARSPFDGAGGGLGFALASMLGTQCHRGAEFILDAYDIDWSCIDLAITGEGKVDEQTAQGKVVDAVLAKAHEHSIRSMVIGGTVTDPTAVIADIVVSTTDYFPELRLSREVALMRLKEAVRRCL